MTIWDPTGRPWRSPLADVSDDTLLTAMRCELEAIGDAHVVLPLEPIHLLIIANLVNHALMDERISGPNRAAGRAFVDLALEYFVDCPALTEVVRRGAEASREARSA
jgi:hypothetical protein